MAERKIKLFVDAHCFDKEHQGAATFIKGIYSLLQHKNDLTIYLAAYDINNLKKHFPDPGNIEFLTYKSRNSLPRLLFDIPALIRKYKIEYAHFQYLTPPIKNCRQILTLHDLLFCEFPEEFPQAYRIKRKFLFRRSTLHADIVTTVSEYSQQAIQAYFNFGPVPVIPNGIDPAFFETYDKQEAKRDIRSKYGMGKFLLYVSRIEPRKNHSILLRAYLQLKLYQQGYYLVLLGHQSIKAAAFDELLATLEPEIRKFIVLKPKVNNDELLEFYRAADLFVYPSKAEGFGIPPLEAAAARVPVICSNATAMKGYSFFGEDHIDASDLLKLKERVLDSIQNEKQGDTLNALSNKVAAAYSWESPAEKFYHLIKANQLT
jgi:glycosyltransferase involved in cell wall biosynthesis